MSDTERFNQFARLKRISSHQDVSDVAALAKVNNHTAILPSHIVMKNGKVAGHFSVANIPMWQGHLARHLVTPCDTFRLIHAVELLLQAQGSPLAITLVGKESGLHKHMGELDYSYVGNADVFIKTLL